MAIKIEALGDTIKIDKAFVSGQDRIAVNGEVVFSGKLAADEPHRFSVGAREYVVESKTVSKMTGVIVIDLAIYEDNEQIYAGSFDKTGKPVQGARQAKENAVIQACATVGAVIGVVTMLYLNQTTGIVPGGAIGGAIGGGGGAALGYGLGSLIFGRK